MFGMATDAVHTQKTILQLVAVPLLASLPKVQGYPTFFLKSGSAVDEYKGPRERSAIVDWLAGRL